MEKKLKSKHISRFFVLMTISIFLLTNVTYAEGEDEVTCDCGDGNLDYGEECDGDNWGNVDGCSDIEEYNYGDLYCYPPGHQFECTFDESECGYDDLCPFVEVIVPPDSTPITWYAGLVEIMGTVSDYESGVSIARVLFHDDQPLTWDDGFFDMAYDPIEGKWVYSWDSLSAMIINDCSIVYVDIFGEDNAGNGVDNNCGDTNVIGIDNEPPTTNKDWTTPYIDCECINDSTCDLFVTPDTEFTLSAYEDCGSGVDETYYSINGEDFQTYEEPFSLQPGCYQTIEYYSVDNVGNIEETHLERDHVDDVPPITVKTFDGLTVDNVSEDNYYVSRNTLVTLTATDQSPDANNCPVGVDYIHYEVWWDSDGDGEVDKEVAIDVEETSEVVSFYFLEDSFHEIRWYAVDLLGNTETEHIQMHAVETVAPVVNKEVGYPRVPYESQPRQAMDYYDVLDDQYYITRNTELTFTCEDLGDHQVGGETIYYKYYVDGLLEQDWTVLENWNFYFPEDSNHELYYYCVDALGNEGEVHMEYDIVDTLAPETIKEFGIPKYDDGELWWLTQSSTVNLSCADQEPHPVGDVTLYWKNFQGDEPESWTVEEDGYVQFTNDYDCLHTIKWYCKDALENTEAISTEDYQVDTIAPTIVKGVNEEGYHQSGDNITICADITDLKGTIEPEVFEEGVGVDPSTVIAYLMDGITPLSYSLERVDETDTYCTTFTLDHCGEWDIVVHADDWLGNHAEEDGATILVDNVAPLGEVLNPHAGNNYYAGKIFNFYAQAVDFGGDYCSLWGCGNEDDCPASGVDYCDVYAIDYNFEALNQDEINECYWDLLTYFEQVLADPYKEYIGRVPYENGVCNGYLTMPEDTNLTDTVFMAVDWVDKAGNSRFGLALNPWFSPITMNMEEIGYMSLTEIFGSPVTSGDLISVKADLYESELGGTKECVGIIERYSGERDLDLTHIITYQGDVTGNVIDGFECIITGTLPGYEDLETGNYRYTTEYRLNDDWQVFTIGSEWFDFIVDNDRPEMGVIDPEEDGIYGEIMPVALYLTDELAGIASESVKVKVSEKGTLANGWCLFGGCTETNWIILSYYADDIYNGEINFTTYGFEESGKYNFEAYACDTLYDPCDDLDCNNGLGYLLDTRNLHHCVPVSDAFIYEVGD